MKVEPKNNLEPLLLKLVNPPRGTPDFHYHLERVNVILGANGSGKSRLLRWIADAIRQQIHWQPGQGRHLVYIEGGRAIEFSGQAKTSTDTSEKAETTHIQHERERLTKRIALALQVLLQRGWEMKNKHSDDADKWDRSGQIGPYPARPDEPLEVFFKRFSEVFPDITLYRDNQQNLMARHADGASHALEGLSDGEKQVFALLADITPMSGEEPCIFLVDEPELNLHPKLACKLWDTIESWLPQVRFVYATLSLGFAMRAGADKLYVINRDKKVLPITHLSHLDRAHLAEFLGSIPAILSHSAALMVEGENEESFDSVFYPWILDSPDVAVVNLRNCEEVLSAAAKQEVWQNLTASVQIAGVVDRDYRSDERVAELTTDNCLSTEYHEAESYLCLPEVVVAVAQGIGSAETIPTLESVAKDIAEFFERNLLSIAAQRTFERTTRRLAVSLPRKAIQGAKTEDAMRQAIRKAAEDERAKAEKLAPDAVEAVFSDELARCKKALASGNPEEMLRLAPGKELLTTLARQAGCAEANAFARAAKKHLKVFEFPHLQALRTRLQEMLSLNPKIVPKSVELSN